METVIYMPLVEEGTDCWRPVRAVRIAEDIFEIIDQIPSDESWKFAPASRVRCRNRIFGGDGEALEAFEYAVESDPHFQLLRKHEKEIFRVVFANGEEARIRVLHVDAVHEDFVYDLLSTDRGRDQDRRDEACASRFDDLVFVQLEV
jgi:hypothetical protein